MKIESIAFSNGQSIPIQYTCQGADISPPLRISFIPTGAKSLALIVEDPDAPRGTFDHWIGWNLEPRENSLEEGSTLPVEGTNGYGKIGYKGPCPPAGKAHRYFFKLYALDTTLDLPPGASKKELEQAMDGHILQKAELIGTYQRRS